MIMPERLAHHDNSSTPIQADRIYGAHAVGKDVIRLRESLMIGLQMGWSLPDEYFGWDRNTIEAARGGKYRIFAVDSIYHNFQTSQATFEKHLVLSPGNPFRLRWQAETQTQTSDVFILGADLGQSIGLDTLVSRVIRSVFLDNLGPEQAHHDPNTNSIIGTTELQEKVFSLRNALFAIKLSEAQQVLSCRGEKQSGAVAILGTAHRTEFSPVWNNQEMQQMVLIDALRSFTSTLGQQARAERYPLLQDPSEPLIPILIDELSRYLGTTDIWRVKEEPGTITYASVSNQIPLDQTFVSPTVYEIIKEYIEVLFCGDMQKMLDYLSKWDISKRGQFLARFDPSSTPHEKRS